MGRAAYVNDNVRTLRNMATELRSTIIWRPEFWIAFKFLVIFTVPLFIMDLVLEYQSEKYVLERSNNLYRVAYATSILVLVTLFSGNQINAFIYFQFYRPRPILTR